MPDKKFIFIITHSYDNPDKAAAALQIATNMKAMDIDLDFFLMDKGVLLAKKGFAETLTWQKKDVYSPVADLMKTLIEDFEVKFFICASCVKHYELDRAELVENSEAKPCSFLSQMLVERQSFTF